MAGMAVGCYSENILEKLTSRRISPEEAFQTVRLEKLEGWDKAVSTLL